jgi:hypothetical protein
MTRTRLILLAVVLLCAGAMLAWQVFWVQPEHDCLAHGGVWAAQYRSCAHPVTITTELVPVPYDAKR